VETHIAEAEQTVGKGLEQAGRRKNMRAQLVYHMRDSSTTPPNVRALAFTLMGKEAIRGF
jgi:hypothetical protein